MKQQNGKTKKTLLSSIIVLIVCIAMLLGTTFAWFTDSVSNTGNRIQAGTLKVKLLKYDANATEADHYKDISNGQGDIFKATVEKAQDSYDTLWEPGKTQIVFLAVENAGNLAVKYNAYIDVTDEGLCDDGNGNSSLECLFLGGVTQEAYETVKAQEGIDSWAKLVDYATALGVAKQDVFGGRTVINTGVLDEIAQTGEKNERDYVALAVHMKEDAGNVYQGKDAIIDVNIVATQMAAEEDGFGSNTYDANAKGFVPAEPIHESVVTKNSVKAETTDTLTFTTSGNVKSATLATDSAKALFTTEEVKDASKDMVLNLNVDTVETKADSVTYDLTLYKTITVTEQSVTIKGEPTKVEDTLASYLTATIDVGTGLNNVRVTHNGKTMVSLASASDEPSGEYAENGGYFYNKETGLLTIKSKTFSPFKVSYDMPFAGGDGTKDNPYQIKTAEQFSNINYFNENTYFKLTENITLLDEQIITSTYDEGTDGYIDTIKNVVIDGNGKKITTSRMNTYSDDNPFIFVRTLGTFELNNIVIENGNPIVYSMDGNAIFDNVDTVGTTTGSSNNASVRYVEYLQGENQNLVFTKCDSSTNITGSGYVGMFVGNLQYFGGNCTINISNCSNSGTITSTDKGAAMILSNSNAGKKLGEVHFNITNTVNNGSVISSQSHPNLFISLELYSNTQVKNPEQTRAKFYLNDVFIDNYTSKSITKDDKLADINEGATGQLTGNPATTTYK